MSPSTCNCYRIYPLYRAYLLFPFICLLQHGTGPEYTHYIVHTYYFILYVFFNIELAQNIHTISCILIISFYMSSWTWNWPRIYTLYRAYLLFHFICLLQHGTGPEYTHYIVHTYYSNATNFIESGYSRQK